MMNLQELYLKISANFWKAEQLIGWVKAHTYERIKHRQARTGTSDASLPIITNSSGYVDYTFLDPSASGPFVLRNGAAGGQTVYGGTAASNALTLYSTSNATKGLINLAGVAYVDEVNGRFGIGTSTPSYELDIYEASAVAVARIQSALTTGRGTLLLEGSASQGYFSAFGATATGTLFGQNVADALAIYSVTASRMQIGTFDSAPLYLGTNNTLAMTIDTSQNVIIGGTAVIGTEKLLVVGNITMAPAAGSSIFRLWPALYRNYTISANSSNMLDFYDATAATSRMTIDSAGDVEIFNDLEVNGAITQAGERLIPVNGTVGGTLGGTRTEYQSDIGDITSTQALTIDITAGAGAGNKRAFITELHFVGHKASTDSIYAISYGTIAWRYNGSGNGIIVVDDTTHASSGTVASAVTAITDGIRITIDSSAFGNTLDRNTLHLTTYSNSGAPTVSTSIA